MREALAAKLSPEAACASLWSRGDLAWKLHDGQLDIYDFIDELERSGQKIGVMRTSRRFGKTYVLGAFANERCLRTPGQRIAFVAPTVKSLKTIILPIFRELLKDCPRHLRPEYKKQDGYFLYPNGSELHLAGADNGHAEKLRGNRFDHWVIDEAGFVRDLRYLVIDILMPTLMYGNGIGLVSSTPPTSPAHYFVDLLGECEAKGAAIRKTIWQNPLLSVKDILEFATAAGCTVDWERFHVEHSPKLQFDMAWGQSLIIRKSVSFSREYEAEILVDPERAVVPEFTEERASEMVRDWKKPEFSFKFTVIDTGFIDYTGVVFGYWDFENAKAVVEDDLLVDFSKDGTNVATLCDLILRKEKDLWGDERPYGRFADGDLIVLSEMSKRGVSVSTVKKDVLEAQVNHLRIDIQRGQLVIQPRAQNVINQLRYAIWNRTRTAFDRPDSGGHFDCLAALIYFVRHLNRTRNPWPHLHGIDTYRQHVPEALLEDRAKNDLSRLVKRR